MPAIVLHQRTRSRCCWADAAGSSATAAEIMRTSHLAPQIARREKLAEWLGRA